ncbi:MAG: hypothetical protein M1829_001277 [Trizodia sp. TS-e1964]|nr:MAG: hypothetical protein M1829_001277 [Trizodia sp. TS-e1964]
MAPLAKKRKTSSARFQSPASTQPRLSPSVLDQLPNKLEDREPLPVLPLPQSTNLPSERYQSIAVSGVLAASIHRSKNTWLTEGIFERYWTRPSRKKNQVQEPINPPKETMAKLGHCTMTIEPHVFDVILYAVKEPLYQTPAAQISSQSPYNQPQSAYSPSGPYSQRPFVPYGASPSNQYQAQGQFQVLPPRLLAQPPGTPDARQIPPTSHPAQATSNNNASSSSQQACLSQGNSLASPPPLQGPSTPIRNPTVPPQNSSPKTSPDPVILMLAARAATDNDLKSLMKTVAGGQASVEELKVFQCHIDELTSILLSQNSNAASNKEAVAQNTNLDSQTPSGPNLPPPQPETPMSQTSSQQLNNIATRPSANNPPAPISPHPSSQTKPQNSLPSLPLHPNPYANPQPQPQPYHYKPQYAYQTPLRAKGVPAQSFRSTAASAPPVEVTSIAFEFVGSSSDRFLLPRYSILEYLAGASQVIMSFLVVRKGNPAPITGNGSTHFVPKKGKNKSKAEGKAAGGKKARALAEANAMLEYYEPVTIKLSALNAKVLEPLGKVTASHKETLDYMNQLMDRATRADESFLVAQLVREEVKEATQDSVEEQSSDG